MTVLNDKNDSAVVPDWARNSQHLKGVSLEAEFIYPNKIVHICIFSITKEKLIETRRDVVKKKYFIRLY